MGGVGSKCCAGGGAASKNPDDKYLDDVEYEKTGIASIDDVLDPAFGILQTAVSINNTLQQTIDTVKLVGSILMGAMAVQLVVGTGDVKLKITKDDDNGDEVPVADILGGTGAEYAQPIIEADFTKIKDNPDALTAIETCAGTLATLNNTLKESEWLGVTNHKTKPGLSPVVGDVGDDAAQKKAVADAKLAIQSFNNTYFTVKLQLLKMNLQGGLSEAISEMIKNIKAVVNDIRPSLTLDTDKLSEGVIDIKPDLGINAQKIANVCPKKVKKCLDALFGAKFLTEGDPMSEGGLIKALKDTAMEVADLMSKFKEVKDAIDALTSDPSKIKDEAMAVGMSGMDLLKFPGKVAANAKKASTTPLILTELFKTIKEVLQEVKSGLTSE